MLDANPYARLVAYMRETATLQSCQRVLGWDQETYMPPGGAEQRAEQLALLAGLTHRRNTAPELKDLIAAAAERATGEAPDSPAAANLREVQRDYARAVCLPAELMQERARTTALARRAWMEARAGRDFETFRPWLEQVLDIGCRMAEHLGYEEHPYDALVDQYEPHETAASITATFAPLRDALQELLAKILDSGVEVDTTVLHRTFPKAAQEALSREAAAAIGFDFERGRLDPTTHPFCSGTAPGDVRLTTRYNERFFNESFFGTLHEGGHGLYEQGLDADDYGMPTGASCSLGIHESQSRLWENFVGRSRAFWKHFLPSLQRSFPDATSGVDLESWYRAINDVRPSFIRVEADEVTYNLHVFLRFELERDLFAGDLEAKDVPDAWHEKFRASFRLTPPDDAQGCLQDVHWSAGYLGYFPTYALGNLYAAQIFETARADLGDLDAMFAEGEFRPLTEWLRANIHRHGRRFRPRDLVERVTGRPPDPQPLVTHLNDKYGEIYGLDS